MRDGRYKLFSFLMIRRPPRSTLFPCPTRFRSRQFLAIGRPAERITGFHAEILCVQARVAGRIPENQVAGIADRRYASSGRDRKSTRLNSSHANISYAVLCLQKKKNIYLRRLYV